MYKLTVSLLFVLAFVNACSQPAPAPFGKLPTEAQLQWHEMEMYTLIHFGVDTYTDKEWGYGDEDPALVNPVDFDAEKIVADIKAGGFKGVIVVAKHHDGMCLWPTKTTPHNISKSPWRSGKGDMIKEYQLACEKLGMKFGVYCSPWDRNHPRYGYPEYVEVYKEQLRELYTNYGSLFISWHDGANGGDGYYGGAREHRQIDRSSYYGWDTIFSMIRTMQPGAVIFGDIGPDVRWVGNEEGHAGETCWATYTPEALEANKKPANGDVKYWLAVEGTRDGKYWMPAECDVPLRPGWFYHASQDEQVKSPYTLLDLYYKSVGRGANLDLGLAPAQNGLLHPNDVASLKEFGKLLNQIFENNLATHATFRASNTRGNNYNTYGPSFLTDDDRYSYWATDDAITNPELIIDLGSPRTFNVIRLRENIRLGQRITSVALDVMEQGKWRTFAEATSIGANRLIRLQQNITAKLLRLRITGADASIALSDFGLYKEPAHLMPPVMLRDKNGKISITTIAPVTAIHYTTDGSEPALQSPKYMEPFELNNGGLVKAKTFGENNGKSETVSKLFGISKKDWKLPAMLNEKHAHQAIDDDEKSIGIIEPADAAGANKLTIDLGASYLISAFTYLPRQDKKMDGVADKYKLYVSADGKTWKETAAGEFSNIRSNPLAQMVKLKERVSARYIRFEAVHLVEGDKLTVAEFDLHK